MLGRAVTHLSADLNMSRFDLSNFISFKAIKSKKSSRQIQKGQLITAITVQTLQKHESSL